MKAPVLTLGILFGLAQASFAQTTVVIEYYHLDGVGSVRAVTNQSAQVVAYHDYFPFGEGEGVAAGQVPVRFTGQERDAETGLDYFGARHYRSRLGRFTAVDPEMPIDAALVNPQLWNRYSYATNRPLVMVDPDGKNPLLIAAGVGAGVFAGWKVYTNIQQGKPWYEDIGVEAAKGLIVGGTLGLAAPIVAGADAGLAIGTGMATAGAAANALGVAREGYVAQLIGGKVAGDFRVVMPNVGSTGVDVLGKAGEFVGVGGPMKGVNISEFGQKLQILSYAAKEAGVRAVYFLQMGASREAYALAEKWLGKGNVYWYQLPQ